jgi:class 3 adenylate cyclase/tetratricopeptide (TPR) repeat protein
VGVDRAQLEAAVAAQEQLRGIVDDDVIDATIAALRDRAAPPAEPRRRQATILFADLVGFTAMSESMDAEDVSSLMAALWTGVDAAIGERGGHIDKHMGDAVMAIWGGETSREDDTEQAVAAALDLQRLVASFAEETGQPVSLRVGLNTGPVVLTRVGTTGEYTALGDAVNLASRLEHAAPSGGICISHDTYRHVRGVFDVHPLDPLEVKGKAELQSAYLVLRAKPRAFRVPTRGVEGIETRMIGRERELAALRTSFEEVIADGCSRLVTIIGEAGAGKSRLLYEFTNWLELHDEAVFFFRGRSTASRQGEPLGLVRDLLAARAGVVESDTPEAVLDKLATEVDTALTRDESVVLSAWLGFDVTATAAAEGLVSGEGAAVTAKSHLTRYLRALTAESPVVWLLEDVHWADDGSLDLVAEMVAGLDDRPFLVTAVGRPEFAPSGAWEAATTTGRRVALAPLDRAATDALVGEILQRAASIPEGLRELVVDRAEGNPFYVEELIKMLIDDGAIEVGAADDPWIIDADRVLAERVPATLTGVLQARLDGLPPPDHGALQRGAVVGRVFWDAAVAAMSGDTGVPKLDHAVERELVFRQSPSAFANTEQFVFKHALVRDVAYESVLLADRPRLHAEAADWLEAAAGPRRGEYLTVIAGHHRQAGNLLGAAECLALVAAAAIRVGQLGPAQVAAEQAVALWDESGVAPPSTVLVDLAEARTRRGDFDGADDAAGRAEVLADTQGDDSALAAAVYAAAIVAARRGHHARSLERLTEVLPIAEKVGGLRLARVLTGQAWELVEAGRLVDAAVAAERAIRVAEGSTDVMAQSGALSIMAVVAAQQGDLDAAAQLLEADLALARQTGDLSKEADDRGNLGVVLHLRADRTGSLDDYRAVRAQYEGALDTARRIGSVTNQITNLNNLAQLLVRLAEPAASLDLSREALATALRAGAFTDAVMALAYRAEAFASIGRVDDAVALLALVWRHPALTVSTAQECARALERMGLDEGALYTAAVLDFDEATAAVLAEPQSGNVG